MRLLFDMEANGLRPDKIWCLVAKDLDTGQVYEFHNGQEGLFRYRHELRTLFSKSEKIIGHSILGYDLFWLDRLGVVPKTLVPSYKVVDTLVLSRLLYPDRFGGHSVEAWATAQNWPVQKQAHEDWSRFSPEMLERCRSDVEIQERIYYALEKEMEGWDWSLSSRISHAMEEELTACSERGWKFDKRRAERYTKYLDQKMEVYYAELKPLLGYYPENRGEVNRPFRKDGSYSKMVQDWRESEDIAGPFTRIEWTPYELTQHEKVAKRLVALGWQPTEYTPTGVPKIKPNGEPCPNLEKVGDVGPTLAAYSKCAHRRNQIAGWLEACRGDGRVPAGFAGITNTGRRRHKIIANVPKAAESVFFGPQMRRCFTVEKGNLQFGWDAAQLEIRIAAHYAGDKSLINLLINGTKEDKTDPASALMVGGDLEDRDAGKKLLYAGIYGAQVKKLMQEFNCDEATAQRYFDLVNEMFPGVTRLKSKVEKAASRGYLVGLDGRKVWMRRDGNGRIMKHKAVNTLFQSAGAIIMDVASLFVIRGIREQSLPAVQVGYVHDEVQYEIHPSALDEMTKLCDNGIQKAEKYFKLRCPLEAEVSWGKTWADSH